MKTVINNACRTILNARNCFKPSYWLREAVESQSLPLKKIVHAKEAAVKQDMFHQNNLTEWIKPEKMV